MNVLVYSGNIMLVHVSTYINDQYKDRVYCRISCAALLHALFIMIRVFCSFLGTHFGAFVPVLGFS